MSNSTKKKAKGPAPLTPFTFINAINTSKKNLFKDIDNYDLIEVEKAYVPFIVNKSLSYFSDTVFHANEMNMCPFLSKDMQFEFFLHSIRKKARFTKWDKRVSPSDIDVVKEVYGFSDIKAQEALSILTKQQINELKNKVKKGGKTK
jgi:hypothetical protein